MQTIYLDEDFKCHVAEEETVCKAETNFFEGKCHAYIEGYRFVPSGSTWIREDGVEFHGEMIAPWKDYAELDAAQREYERQQIRDYEAALSEIEAALGVSV